MDFSEVIEDLADFLISQNSNFAYSIYIGTDSEEREQETEYITAIVIYRHGRGGRYFTERTMDRLEATLRDRIWRETVLSTDIAREVIRELAARGLQGHVEIHCDIGEQGPTRDLIREICGFVRGNGFEVAIKPVSFAASSVADRML
jgi:predicted RNase H-related nuclease YkuK (DUF458 family)